MTPMSRWHLHPPPLRSRGAQRGVFHGGCPNGSFIFNGKSQANSWMIYIGVPPGLRKPPNMKFFEVYLIRFKQKRAFDYARIMRTIVDISAIISLFHREYREVNESIKTSMKFWADLRAKNIFPTINNCKGLNNGEFYDQTGVVIQIFNTCRHP